MNQAVVDIIRQSKTCQGAYRLTDDGLAPLSQSLSGQPQIAARTREVWAHVGAMVTDAGLMIAKRDTSMSIASRNGGVILEANGPVNIGMLRAVLQKEDPVTPTPETVSPKANALWTLADWIDGTEAARCLDIDVGGQAIQLLAAKGRFAILSDHDGPDTICEAIAAATQQSAEITLGLGPLPSDLPDATFTPLDLFAPKHTEAGNWIIAADGRILACPKGAEFEDAQRMATTSAHIAAWGDGASIEVAILCQKMRKHIVATANADGDITLTLPAT